jgi:dCMP deaminase
MEKRASWDEYFLKIAHEVSSRATCDRAHVGCVLVQPDTHSIVATGYNGSIRGEPHCDVVGHDVVDNHCVRTIHAEVNAVVAAARVGNRVEGATAYVTHFPCWACFKMLANAGVKRVVYGETYRDDQRVREASFRLGIDVERPKP